MKLKKNDPAADLKGDARKDALALRHPLFKKKPGQIDKWLENNVQDMDDVRAVLRILVKAVRANKRAMKQNKGS